MMHQYQYINKILCGNSIDLIKLLPDNSINSVVTSPPYWGLRDYENTQQFGLEKTPKAYARNLVKLFKEVRRVLKNDGTLWLNLGDSYCSTAPGTFSSPLKQEGVFAGIKQETANARKNLRPKTPKGMKPKDLVGIPWMIAFALRENGWYLRQDIIWNKPNPMPESVTDRCTKSHEYIFLLSKSRKYYFDNQAIKTDAINPEADKKRFERQTWDNKSTPDVLRNGIRPKGKKWEERKRDGEVLRHGIDGPGFHGVGNFYSEKANKRSVWTVNTKPFPDAHFATFPQELIVDCIKAGCPENGIILDPFMGAGTTALVARKLSRNFVGFELNPEYIKIAEGRLYKELGMFI